MFTRPGSLYHEAPYDTVLQNSKLVLTQRSKEPPILPARVSLFQRLLYRFLCILPLRNLLERIVRNHALQTLQLQSVARWHQVVVIDGLDEWLNLAAFCLAGFRHSSGDLGRITLDTGDKCVRERMGF